MGKQAPRKVYRYSDDFKAQAVRLSELPGVEVQEVAEALAIHPFMLSRWRKQVREGVIVVKNKKVDPEVAAELKALRKLKRKYKLLEEEHTALKKFIAWEAEQKQTASKPSTPRNAQNPKKPT